jgi:PAS domain S-box-containing protein
MASRPTDPLTAEALEAALEGADLLVVIVDVEGRILHFNPAAQRLSGLAADEVLGASIWRLSPEDRRDEARDAHEALCRSGLPHRSEADWITKRGEVRRIAWSHSVVRDERGRVERGIATGIDVTDLRVSQSGHRDSQQHLEAIVESAMDAIVTVDESQRIVVFNEAAEAMFGYAASEVLGCEHELLVPERFREIHSEQVRKFADSGTTSRSMGELGFVSGRRADGSVFPAEASISRARSDGKLLLTAIFRDISERVRLEQQLHQSQETASLGALIAGLAHDIGTPLNVILGYIGMLGRSLSTDKDRDRLRIVREQVERVTGLVQTLMNYSRPSDAKPTEIRIESVLERALELIPELARRRGVSIERRFGDTPTLRAQGDRLERAFLNLMVNACDAMGESGGTLRVSTATSGEGGVRVRIADEGRGIPEAMRQRIFDPFYTTKERGSGSGLGLFVTRGIVLEQGGTIGIESPADGGTTFVLTFPPATRER